MNMSSVVFVTSASFPITDHGQRTKIIRKFPENIKKLVPVAFVRCGCGERCIFLKKGKHYSAVLADVLKEENKGKPVLFSFNISGECSCALDLIEYDVQFITKEDAVGRTLIEA